MFLNQLLQKRQVTLKDLYKETTNKILITKDQGQVTKKDTVELTLPASKVRALQ